MISYGDKMPCSITDGEQFEDQPKDYEVDMTDERRQETTDDLVDALRDIAKLTELLKMELKRK
jgi:hypothetical protein